MRTRPDGNYLYLLNSFSEVTIWDTQNGELINTLNPSTDYEEFSWEKEIRLSLSTDGARLLMENPTKIIVWDTKSWQELINVKVPQNINMWPFCLNLFLVSSIVFDIIRRLSSGVKIVLSIFMFIN